MENKNQSKTTEWTKEQVADAFEKAIRTLRKLPPVQVQGYFNCWPDVIYSEQEIMRQEPQPRKLRASA